MSGPYADLLHKGFDEFRRFVNPLVSQRAALAGEPYRIVKTDGGRLVDADGKIVEDFHGTQFFGHRHPAITAAVRDYLDSDAANWFPARVNPFMGRLARRLHELTGYDNAFFGFGGSDTVEAALKLARGATGKTRLLGMSGAYHGCTYGALSLMQDGWLKEGFGPHLPASESLPFGDLPALRGAFAAGDVAAVVVEPIQGEGGVRPLPPEYLAALCELTEEHGALLVADEVQTGMGRTGHGILRSASWPRRPDCVVLAKHFGGGLAPTAVMLTRRELFMQAYGRDFARGESHNCTMGANAIGAVAAMAALDLLTPEVCAEVARKGAWFKSLLEETLAGNDLVREVRGEGLMLGIALHAPDHPWLSFEHFGMRALEGEPSIGPLLCHRVYKRGYFCFPCGHDWTVFRLQPRFDVPERVLREFATACREELDFLCQLT